MNIRLEFKPQDLWVGASWKVGPSAKRYAANGEVYYLRRVDVWVCLLPTVSVHLWWLRGATPE